MSNKYIDRLKEIIEMSFRTLEMKIANGGVISKNDRYSAKIARKWKTVW